jgi:phosphatidylglycerol---prolipoprotein diacylglyceryl transferase
VPKLTFDLDPVLATVGGSQIRYYGLCFVLSLLFGHLLLGWQLRRGGGDREESGDFLVLGAIGMFVGARIGHVLWYDFDRFVQDPTLMWKVWQGGLASHGGALGLGLAMHWFTRRRAIPFLEGTDRLALAVPVGAFLFRVGNLFNSEIVGKPTDGSWGIRFPRYDFANGDFVSGDGPYRHPTQVYEMALAALVFGLLFAADRRYGREARPRGVLTGLLLVSMFTGRFLVEFLKEPLAGVDGVLHRAQVLSVPFIVVGLAILVRSVRNPQRAGWVVGSARPARS